MTTTSEVDYSYLRQIVYRCSQNVLDPSSDYLFQTRLGGLLRRRGLSHLHELVRHLRAARDPELERAVAEAMTINETSFFRDVRPFDLIRTELLPKLIDARCATQKLRFWSAASSTGQEAYSLAMLIREYFPQLSSWNVRIEATDICAEVIERARSGRYHRIEVNRGLPARMLVRYFDRIGEDWVVKPGVARLCSFRQANLCEALPFHERFDIVLLRNVMIYLSLETRSSLLVAIHRLMAPDGYLVLGSAERAPDPSIWTTVLAGGTCYYRPC